MSLSSLPALLGSILLIQTGSGAGHGVATLWRLRQGDGEFTASLGSIGRCLKRKEKGGWRDGVAIREHLRLLQRSRIQFPAPMPGNSQWSAAPAPLASSGTCTHVP